MLRIFYYIHLSFRLWVGAVFTLIYGLEGFAEEGSKQLSRSVEGLQLLTPVDNARTYSRTPDFCWASEPDADRYEIEIAADPEFEKVIDRDVMEISRYVADQPLPVGELYWRVRAIGEDGDMRSASVSQFEIRETQNIYDIPDGADAAGIEQVIKEAAANTPCIVRFAKKGRYRIAPTDTDLIKLHDVSDMIIEGQGAELIITEVDRGLAHLIECNGILIRDLTIRYDPLPFAIGVVQSVDDSTGEFSVVMEHPELPAFDSPTILKHWTWGVLLDPNIPGKLLDDSPLVLSTIEREVRKQVNGEGEATYTLELKSPHQAKFFTPGSKYIVFARHKGRGLTRVEGGKDVTFFNLINYGVSGGHYTSFESSALKVLHCQSLIPDGQWFGGNADGLHVRSSKVGPWVEKCKFEGIGDDAIAIYAKGVFILKQESPTELRVDLQFCNLKAGHTVRIFNPRDGTTVVEEAKVDSIELQNAGAGGVEKEHFLLTLTEPIKQQLETNRSDPLLNDQIFSLTFVNRDFAVRNNRFSRIRRFGTVVRAISGVIEKNDYAYISNVPIVLRNEPDLWRNGLSSQDIYILNNTISDSGFVRGREGKGQIEVVMYKIGHAVADGRGHENIVISGNLINNWQEYGISVQNARNVQILNNLLTSDLNDFDNDRSHFGIHVNNAEEVIIEGNRINDSRRLDAVVEVSENTDRITIKNN